MLDSEGVEAVPLTDHWHGEGDYEGAMGARSSGN